MNPIWFGARAGSRLPAAGCRCSGKASTELPGSVIILDDVTVSGGAD